MTIKQKQCLLTYLGYDTGGVDGIWGEQSEAAAQKFQKDFGGIAVDGIVGSETEKALTHAVAYGMPGREPEDEPQKGSVWDSTNYFTREEFACKCGKCGGFPAEPNPQLVMLADDVRTHFNAVVDVSSGVRCKAHNAAVGGVANSRHLTGKAMDFRVRGKTAAQVLGYVNEHISTRYAYAINDTYVHMDVE